MLTLKEAQEKVDNWIKKFEEGYWPPLAMLASLIEEIGELSREINNIQGYKRKKSQSSVNVELELGDIIFSLICIANYFQIDLEKSFLKTMMKYSTRDSKRWTRKK